MFRGVGYNPDLRYHRERKHGPGYFMYSEGTETTGCDGIGGWSIKPDDSLLPHRREALLGGAFVCQCY